MHRQEAAGRLGLRVRVLPAGPKPNFGTSGHVGFVGPTRLRAEDTGRVGLDLLVTGGLGTAWRWRVGEFPCAAPADFAVRPHSCRGAVRSFVRRAAQRGEAAARHSLRAPDAVLDPVRVTGMTDLQEIGLVALDLLE